MQNDTTRRDFIRQTGMIGSLAIVAASPLLSACSKLATTKPIYEISLAQWSLNRAIFSGEMNNLDFAVRAKNEFGISAVEYVNQFFKDKATDKNYIGQMKEIADDNGVKSVLIMIDGEGNLGDADDALRTQAIENHYKWVEAAKQLGCHSIRVNAAGSGTAEEVQRYAKDGLYRLCTFAKDYDINVIVENHGGYSSNGKWLSELIKSVETGNCGTLPDFGNFCITRDAADYNKCLDEYDRYQGLQDLIPYAKGVSAKAHDFDENGNEIHTDFARMFKIIGETPFSGYIGLEYEGDILSEPDGIKATKALVEKTMAAMK